MYEMSLSDDLLTLTEGTGEVRDETRIRGARGVDDDIDCHNMSYLVFEFGRLTHSYF